MSKKEKALKGFVSKVVANLLEFGIPERLKSNKVLFELWKELREKNKEEN